LWVGNCNRNFVERQTTVFAKSTFSR
jgi:hypothetical protein